MSIPATEVAVLDTAPAPTPSKRARLRFLRGGKTITGISILGFFTLLAIIGPWIAPYDPDMMSDQLLQPPRATTGSAPRRPVRTYCHRSSSAPGACFWWASSPDSSRRSCPC